MRDDLIEEQIEMLLNERKPDGGAKVVYVPDAGIGSGFDGATMFAMIEHEFDTLSIPDVHVVCVELRGMKPKRLEKALKGVDCIYVDMGNTFYLGYQMRKSGFFELVPPLVNRHGVIYVGASAGSVAAGATLGTAFWKGWDDPGYGQEWDLARFGYDGLNLIPGGKSIFPHYGAQYEGLVNKRKGELAGGVVVLKDGEAYMVEGGREEKVHDGEVDVLEETPLARFPWCRHPKEIFSHILRKSYFHS